MYGVISYWVGEDDVSQMWLYQTEKEAIDAMQRLWEQSYNLALEDENFDEERSYHEENLGCVAWNDGLYRFFEVVKQSKKEEL